MNKEEVYTISRVVEILNGLRHDHGDIEVRIDAMDFGRSRKINSINYATTVSGDKFICFNNYE